MQPSPQAQPALYGPLVEDGQEPPTSKRVSTFSICVVRKFLDGLEWIVAKRERKTTLKKMFTNEHFVPVWRYVSETILGL